MSDYARLSVSLEVSESSDYSDPFLKPKIPTHEFTPDEAEWRLVDASTAGVTVDLGMYTTLTYVIVYNDDTTIDVCATLTPVGGHVGSPAASPHDIGPKKIAIFPDVDPASDLVLDSESGTPRVFVGVVGT